MRGPRDLYGSGASTVYACMRECMVKTNVHEVQVPYVVNRQAVRDYETVNVFVGHSRATKNNSIIVAVTKCPHTWYGDDVSWAMIVLYFKYEPVGWSGVSRMYVLQVETNYFSKELGKNVHD